MGFGGISIWQLLIILAIVILLFGTKRLRSFGSDLGNAVKGFRSAMHNEDEKTDTDDNPSLTVEEDDVIDSRAEKVADDEKPKTP